MKCILHNGGLAVNMSQPLIVQQRNTINLRTDESEQRLKTLLSWSQIVEKLFCLLHQASIPATRGSRWEHVDVSLQRLLVAKTNPVPRSYMLYSLINLSAALPAPSLMSVTMPADNPATSTSLPILAIALHMKPHYVQNASVRRPVSKSVLCFFKVQRWSGSWDR